MKLHKILLSSAVMGVLIVGGVCALSDGAEAQVGSVSNAPKNQTTDSKSVARNWGKRCEKDSKYSEVFQRLDVKENKKRLVEVAIGFPVDTKKPRLAAILPLGLSLPDGMVIQIAGQKDLKSVIKTCTEAGCVSFVELSDSYLDTLKKSDKMTIVLKDSSGKKVNIVMSLGGLSEALKTI